MAKRVHRRDVRRFGIGVVALTVIGLVAGIGVSMQTGGGLPARKYTYVDVEFEDVGWLSSRAQVAENGVRIGQVESIALGTGQVAIVTLRLEGDRTVYQNATASISNASVLGKRRILLNPGTADAGALGDRPISTAQTQDSKSLDDIYAGLDRRTRNALASSVRELGVGLAGHSEDLHGFLRSSAGSVSNLGEISATLTSPQADLRTLLATANRLTGRFSTRESELTDLLEQTDSTLRAITVDDEKPLRDTLHALPASLREARRGLNSLNGPLADLRIALATLEPGGRALGQSADDLRGILREAVSPLDKVPSVGESADRAVGDLTSTVADARPLVSRLARGLTWASLLLHDLAPYASDIGRWASEHDVLSGRVRPGEHYLSLTPILPGPYALSLPDPTVDRDPYPAPGGGAWTHQERQNSYVGGAQ